MSHARLKKLGLSFLYRHLDDAERSGFPKLKNKCYALLKIFPKQFQRIYASPECNPNDCIEHSEKKCIPNIFKWFKHSYKLIFLVELDGAYGFYRNTKVIFFSRRKCYLLTKSCFSEKNYNKFSH